MALKKRTVVSPAAGAVSLPSLMADLPGTRRLEEDFRRMVAAWVKAHG